MGILTTDNILNIAETEIVKNIHWLTGSTYLLIVDPLDNRILWHLPLKSLYDFEKLLESSVDYKIGDNIVYAINKTYIDTTNKTVKKNPENTDFKLDTFFEALFNSFVFPESDNLPIKEGLKTLINNLIVQSATESSLPIGFIYVQFPFTDDPATLGMAGTWENITSQFNGAFFRAENRNINAGLLSEEFQVLQSAGLPNIKGTFGTVPTGEGYDSQNTGAFYFVEHTEESVDTWGPDNGHRSVYGFDASRYNSLYGSSNSVTPANYAIRIWKRVN